MRPSSFFLFLFFFALLATSVHAQTLPSPQGYVTDTANVLTNRAELETQLRTLNEETGVQIAILTILTTSGEDIAAYSGRVFDAWKVGNAERDDGLLIVLATEDRAYFIQTGYGLEGTLPDVLIGRIARNEMVPLFAEGNFSDGIHAGTIAFEGIIRQDPEILANYADEEYPIEFELFNMGIGMMGVMVVLLVLVLIKQYSKLKKDMKKVAEQAFFVCFFSGMAIVFGGLFTLLTFNGFYGFTLTSVLLLYWLLFGSVPLFTAAAMSGGSVGRGFGGGGFGGFGGGSSGGGGFGGFGGGSSGGGGAGGRF